MVDLKITAKLHLHALTEKEDIMKRLLLPFAIANFIFGNILLLLGDWGTLDATSAVATAPSLQVNYAYDWVAGKTTPGAAVSLIHTDGFGYLKNSANISADVSGNFRTNCSDWVNGPCVKIEVGDLISATVQGETGTVGPLGSIEGVVDITNNVVTGTLNATGQGDFLVVQCTQLINGVVWSMITESSSTDNGTFICDYEFFPWNLEPSHVIILSYFEPDDDEVQNVASSSQILNQYIYLPAIIKP
jgi:hypothetical protein